MLRKDSTRYLLGETPFPATCRDTPKSHETGDSDIPPAHGTATVLPAHWYVAVMAGAVVVIAWIGFLARMIGRELGGEVGMRVGEAVRLMVLIGTCLILARALANPTVPLISGALVGTGFAGVADGLIRNFAGGWVRAVGFVVSFAAFRVWISVIYPRVASRRASSPAVGRVRR